MNNHIPTFSNSNVIWSLYTTDNHYYEAHIIRFIFFNVNQNSLVKTWKNQILCWEEYLILRVCAICLMYTDFVENDPQGENDIKTAAECKLHGHLQS